MLDSVQTGDSSIFNNRQRATLVAILDTFVAPLSSDEKDRLINRILSINPSIGFDKQSLSEFADLSGSSCSNNVINKIEQRLQSTASEKQRQHLGIILNMLSSMPTLFLLTGGKSGLRASSFSDLNRKDRERILLGWKQSRLGPVRLIYNTFMGLCLQETYFGTDSLATRYINTYTSASKDDKSDLFPSYVTTASTTERTHRPGGYEYFKQHPDYEKVTHERLHMLSTEEVLRFCSPLTCQQTQHINHGQQDSMRQQHFDAIIIGSGAGGGVAAAELAKAGLSVLVIEKGAYFHQDDLQPDDDRFAFSNMYDNGGILPNATGTVNLMSGSTFGGGTAVNYSASIKPPKFIREEWARMDLPYFGSEEFSKDLDTVCERIGVTTENVHHNGPNQKLLNGCRALEYATETVPQNTSGRAHYCGKCYTGCASGVKNGTMNTWLKDAATHGAKFLDRTRVTRVLFEQDSKLKEKRAAGVVCQLHGEQECAIYSKFVIVAGGALHTPSLLRRSGFNNPNIGKDLRLHLSTLCIGVYDDLTHPSEGTLLTVICNEFGVQNSKQEGNSCRTSNDNDNSTYGYKIECFTNGPGLFSGMLPWLGAAQHKEMMLRYRNAVVLFAMLRDKDSTCRVQYDRDDPNKVDVQFQLSEYDGTNLKEGLIELAKIHVAAGARKVLCSQHPIIDKPMFEFLDDEDASLTNPRFLEWLELIRRSEPPVPASGHQMASCRMGRSPKNSATKMTGETWDVKNVYVADSSLFPTALGVNPMVTIEAISLSVTRHIIEAYHKQGQKSVPVTSKL